MRSIPMQGLDARYNEVYCASVCGFGVMRTIINDMDSEFSYSRMSKLLPVDFYYIRKGFRCGDGQSF
ncbi:MAG: hypothetical protein ACJAUG_003719 [Halioglobus sp.]|jgi:hypothetical protein